MTLKDIIISGISHSVKVEDDVALLRARELASLTTHSKNYDTILSNYSFHVEKTLNSKRIMKKVFFWLSFIIMLLCILSIAAFTFFTMLYSMREDFNIQSFIIPFITAITSFLTVFIVIPKIIAEYLFDNSEEAVMQKMIVSIQDYDKFIRTNLWDENKENKKEMSENLVEK